MSENDITIRKIMTLLQSEYPASFSNMDARTMTLKMNLWETEFEHDDIRLVYAAIRLYMKKPERFAPTIGQIRENMNSLLHDEAAELSDQDAWALVSKACANGYYGYREEFAKLPPDVQAAIGAPEQLKAWAVMDEETVESVVASNFKKTFRANRERHKQLDTISPDVKSMLSEISGKMGLTGGNRKQLEQPKPKEPALMPAKLEPLGKPLKLELPKPAIQEPAYKPPDPEEFEKRRQRAMQALLGRKEDGNVICNESHETQSSVTAGALSGEQPEDNEKRDESVPESKEHGEQELFCETA